MNAENRQLSAEQSEVVRATDARLTVSAAAGAGKTFVLVERYLRHVVEDGIPPDSILTITFTKKAAAQMKSRIVRRLRESGLHAEAQIAETGPVQTIHSFCERLLRENSLEAGLDPEFEILSESQTKRWVTDCVRDAIADPLEDQPEAEALLAFLAGAQRYGESNSPYGKLEGAVEQVLHELRGSGVSKLQIEQWHLSPSALREKWESVVLESVSESARAAFANVEANSFAERLQGALKAERITIPSWLKGKPNLEAEEEALVHTCGLVQIACAAWGRLNSKMERHQALDFAALEERAVRLLAKSAVTRDRLKDAYRVVMIDEAQDLNQMQYNLLQGLQPETRMLVGDVQQSIYGFRQADVRHFKEQAEREQAKRLSRNYRSEEGILRFVDFVFGAHWGADYKPMAASADFDLDNLGTNDFSGVEVWRQAANDLDAVAGYVGDLRAEGVPLRDITILVRDAVGASAIQRGLEGAGVPCRIAGGSERFYTRLEIRDLANALRSVADPYDDFSLLACLHSPMVGLSLDSILLLAGEPSVVERLSEFTPPIEADGPKLKAFLSWYEPLRRTADRLAAWEVLGELFARSNYLAALARRENSAQLLANARKLLTLAAKEPELGPLEYAERIREIQDIRHKEGDAPADEEQADVVTIMTVHKAKGLEFPVVILSQTDKRLTSQIRDVVVEPRLGLTATKFGNGQCLMHKLLSDKKKEREEQEEMRVLYVALTRAQKRLCICLYPPNQHRTSSKMLGALIGDTPPPGILVRDTNFA